jgi:LPS export ABC transporter protein LptC
MPSQFSILVLALLISLFSCGKEQTIDDMATYDGPALEADNVETLYSDSAVLRVRLTAPKQLELQNGNREFPKGLYVEFFDERGKKSSTLKSDRGTFKKEENLYIVKGNVKVDNLVEKQSLHSEELNWDPETKKVYTDKKVRIVGPEQILTGIGLEANQDFSLYKIKEPTGVFPVEE